MKWLHYLKADLIQRKGHSHFYIFVHSEPYWRDRVYVVEKIVIQNPSVYRYQLADFNPNVMKTLRGHTPFRGEQLNIKGKSDLKEVLDVGLVSCLKLDGFSTHAIHLDFRV